MAKAKVKIAKSLGLCVFLLASINFILAHFFLAVFVLNCKIGILNLMDDHSNDQSTMQLILFSSKWEPNSGPMIMNSKCKVYIKIQNIKSASGVKGTKNKASQLLHAYNSKIIESLNRGRKRERVKILEIFLFKLPKWYASEWEFRHSYEMKGVYAFTPFD